MSTNDNNHISPHSKNHVEPVNGSSSDNNRRNSSSPAANVTYEDLVQNADIFWEKLYALLGETQETLKLPILGGGVLDLHQLFIKVTARGGYEKVIHDRKWKEVVLSLNYPAILTSASYAVRKNYLTYLRQMEQEYYVPKPDEGNEVPVPMEGVDEMPVVGGRVRGFIDGRFESGYLVTVRVGSQLMKGVLYHLPGSGLPQPTNETPRSPPLPGVQAPPAPPAFSAVPAFTGTPHPPPISATPFISAPPGFPVRQPSPAVAPSSSQRRRNKKKAKLEPVDDQKPKCQRSGYNFFFQEQHARLRPEFEGREREITKAIGNLWSNLPEAEKQVYQDQGLQDSARYRAEMLEYKSALEAGAAEMLEDKAAGEAGAASVSAPQEG